MTSHPSNTLELEESKKIGAELHTLAGNFASTLDLSHIWVSKYYFDGRYIDISNDPAWKDIMVLHHFYAQYIDLFLKPLSENSATKGKSLNLSWQANKFSNASLIDRVHLYGIISHLNFFFVHDDHIESYGFGSSQEINNLNKKLFDEKEMQMFCLYLREKIYHKISSSTTQLGFSETSFTPPSFKQHYSHTPIPTSFTFSCNQHEAKLTRREVECLGLIAKGYSQKEMARLLNISARTVEYYLLKIKLKYNNPSKLELISKFNSSPLALIDPFFLINSGSEKE